MNRLTSLRLVVIALLAGLTTGAAQEDRPQLPEPSDPMAKALEPARPTTQALEQAWPNQPVPSSSMPRLPTAEEMSGWEVVSQEGKELGTLEDFAVDVASGRIAYALVKSGGVLGLANRTHAVPYRALKVGSIEERTFTLGIDEDRWSDAPEFDEDELQELAGTEERRRLHEFYQRSLSSEQSAQSGERTDAPHDIGQPQLRLASELKDVELRHQDEKVGEGDAVLLNLIDGEAFLRIGPDASVVGSNEALVLTFKQLQVDRDDDDRLLTRLSVEDLRRARPSLSRDTRAAE